MARLRSVCACTEGHVLRLCVRVRPPCALSPPSRWRFHGGAWVGPLPGSSGLGEPSPHSPRAAVRPGGRTLRRLPGCAAAPLRHTAARTPRPPGGVRPVGAAVGTGGGDAAFRWFRGLPAVVRRLRARAPGRARASGRVWPPPGRTWPRLVVSGCAGPSLAGSFRRDAAVDTYGMVTSGRAHGSMERCAGTRRNGTSPRTRGSWAQGGGRIRRPRLRRDVRPTVHDGC